MFFTPSFRLCCIVAACILWRLSLAGPACAGALVEETLLGGLPGETLCHIQKSDEPGPVVLIIGGMHGNEPAGSQAADQIRHWPIRRGTIICVPRANALALAANSRSTPNEEPDLADLNRNFPRAGMAEPPRGVLAKALWQRVEAWKPQWIIDLHEGAGFSRASSGNLGNSIISSRDPESRAAAELLLKSVNAAIDEESRHFTLREPPVDGSLARAAAEHLGCHSVILTTTSRQPPPLRARQHRIMVHALLSHLGMLDAAVTPNTLATPRSPGGATKIALYNDGGVGGRGVPQLEKLVGSRPDVRMIQVCGDDVRAGVLDQFDVAIFSGGSGSGQAASLQEEGREKVRKFVERGGTYVGICAGSYLACNGFSWGLKILNARTASPRWRRGAGQVEIELSTEGKEIFEEVEEKLEIRYVNGPILVPDESLEIPPYQTLAWYRTELAENGSPAGVMVNSPAIVSGVFGQGRVVCFGPHPEQTAGCEAFVWQAIGRVGELVGAMQD